MRERPTKTGKRMAWVTLEDLTGSVSVVCFPAKEGGRSVMGKDGRWARTSARPGFENWEALLKGDEPVLVTGAVQINQRDEEQPTAEIIAEQVESLREMRDRRVKRLQLRVAAEILTDERLRQLAELGRLHAGSTPLSVCIVLPGQAEANIENTSLKVAVSDELLRSVEKLFGGQVAELV